MGAAQPITLPAPYQGQQDRIPLAAAEYPYAEIVTNYNLDDGIAKLRKGDACFADFYAALPASTGKSILGLCSWGDSKLFAVFEKAAGEINLYEITSGTPVLSNAGSAPLYLFFGSFEFNNKLFVFPYGGNFSSGNMYDGTSWAASGYTYPVGFSPGGGCGYKHRAYIWEGFTSTKFCYGGIDLIAGAMTGVDLAGLVRPGAGIVAIAPFTIADGAQNDTALAFLFSSGEILVYSGQWPNSSDWNLVGKFLVPRLFNRSSFIEVNGDLYVITEGGVLSLRDLFAGGVRRARDEGPSYPITNRYDDITSALSLTTPARGIYDKSRDRLIVGFMQYVTRAGAADSTHTLQLVMSLKTKAIWERMSMPAPLIYVQDAIVFQGDNYWTGRGFVYKQEAASGYVDTTDKTSGTAPYVYQLRSASVPLSKSGVNSVKGIEVIMKSDMYAQTDFKLISDLGTKTTAAQKTSGDGTNVTKTMVNAGIVGNYVQIDVSGTTVAGKTVGQEIYGFNVWNENGGFR